MPNWCSTTYKFYADSETGKHQLKEFHAVLETAISENPSHTISTSFGDSWLGYVIQEFCPEHICYENDNITCHYKNQYIPFRGNISSSDEYENDVVTFSTETAWRPMPEMWDMILESKGYTDIKYVYEAEEDGNCLYINTDKEKRFFTDKYYAEINFPDELSYCSEYCEDEVELLEWLNNIIEEMKKAYSNDDYNLPENYDISILCPQQSVDAAVSLIDNNLFSKIGDDDEPYLIVCEFTEGLSNNSNEL